MTTDTERPVRESTPIIEESMLETTLQSPTEATPSYGQGKGKLIRKRTEQKSPGRISLQMYLEKMNGTEDRQQDITPTTEDDHNAITVIDRNGNTDLIKIERTENTNLNINNDNETTTRKPTRIKTANPIIRHGNPIPH